MWHALSCSGWEAAANEGHGPFAVHHLPVLWSPTALRHKTQASHRSPDVAPVLLPEAVRHWVSKERRRARVDKQAADALATVRGLDEDEVQNDQGGFLVQQETSPVDNRLGALACLPDTDAICLVGVEVA